jgi:hypothetical protein
MHAERLCQQQKARNPKSEAAYLGHIQLPVLRLAAIGPEYAVFHEPTPDDCAHANLVRRTPFPEIEPQALANSEFRRLDDAIAFFPP